MKQLYTQFLVDYPDIETDKSLIAIQPVLHGNAWLHSQKTPATTDLTPPSTQTWPFFLAVTSGLTLKAYQPKFQENGLVYDRFDVGMRREFIQSFLQSLYRTQANVTSEEMSKIFAVIQNSPDFENTQLTILIDPREKTLAALRLHIPSTLLQELKSAQTEKITSTEAIAELYSRPLALIDLLPETQDTTELALNFSQFNQMPGIEAPTQLVETANLEKKGQIVPFILQYLSDPAMLTKATSPKNLYLSTSHETKLLFEAGDYANGLKKATELLSLATTDEEKGIAYYWLGLQNYKLKNTGEAQTQLLKATTLKAKYAPPYVTLGAMSLEQGNYQQMLDYSLLCAEYDPNYAWCHNNIGIAYMSLGQSEPGLAALQKAVSLDPLNFTFNNNLTRAKTSVGK